MGWTVEFQSIMEFNIFWRNADGFFSVTILNEKIHWDLFSTVSIGGGVLLADFEPPPGG